MYSYDLPPSPSDNGKISVVGVVAAAVGAAIGLVFLWWGVRWAARTLMAAFRKGRVKV